MPSLVGQPICLPGREPWPLSQAYGHGDRIFDLAFHPLREDMILSASEDTSVRLWRRAEGTDTYKQVGNTTRGPVVMPTGIQPLPRITQECNVVTARWTLSRSCARLQPAVCRSCPMCTAPSHSFPAAVVVLPRTTTAVTAPLHLVASVLLLLPCPIASCTTKPLASPLYRRSVPSWGIPGRCCGRAGRGTASW